MVIQDRVSKQEGAVSRRLNELGLKAADVRFLDWSPMFVDLVYDETPEQKAEREKQENRGPRQPQAARG